MIYHRFAVCGYRAFYSATILRMKTFHVLWILNYEKCIEIKDDETEDDRDVRTRTLSAYDLQSKSSPYFKKLGYTELVKIHYRIPGDDCSLNGGHGKNDGWEELQEIIGKELFNKFHAFNEHDYYKRKFPEDFKDEE